MPASTLRTYKGAPVSTTTTNSLSAIDTSVTLAAITGWPTASDPFYVVIDPGTSSEEKCRATISGSTLTLTRAADDTTGVTHASGATIYPCATAVDFAEANALTSTVRTGSGSLVFATSPTLVTPVLGTVAAGSVLTNATGLPKTTGLANATLNTQTASYVLVAGDRQKVVTMNAAGATTITVNTSLFAAQDTVQIVNIGAGTCTVTAGTATVTGSGLALSQWGGGTLYFTAAGTSIFFPYGGVSWGTATGGTGVVAGPTGYQYTSFTSNGTLTVTKAGLFEVLMFGGGSGGAGGDNGLRGGGGGAAGAKLQAIVYLTANQSIVVGAGTAGGGANSASTEGATSSVGTLLAIPGGAGARGDTSPVVLNLGCGGGGRGETGKTAGGTSVLGTNFGYDGGTGVNSGGGGGGGGVAAVGANAVSTTGGAGGAGYDVSAFIGGSALYKGGGGGGGGSVAGGAGGSSVGGSGTTTTGNAAAANTGSGGGGGLNIGGAGGSGIVYIRWQV